MRDNTAKDNRQTSRLDSDAKQRAGFFFHDKSSILPFSNTEIVLFQFQFIYKQRIGLNDMLVTYYGKAMLNRVDQIGSDQGSDKARQRV